MPNYLHYSRRPQLFNIVELSVIVGLSLVPIFFTFPYRVNIFLSWEGAYRLSEGQVPYRDFGMPMGFMYWVVPSIFFKIFGPQLITLVKAQVLINIVSGLAFRSVIKSMGIDPGIRMMAVLVYCLSYSFFNFWPWYNHTVIVYEMVGLAFLFLYTSGKRQHWIWLCLSSLFVFFSFFTKQDGGALAFILCFVLIGYYSIANKTWKPVTIFTSSFFVVALCFIAPLTRYSFGYWFNHGQPPHTARFSLYEIVEEFLAASGWIKFYLLVIIVLAISSFRCWKELIVRQKETTFLLLTLGILAEAAVLQVTSYTPPDNNIFFHSFAFAYILYALSTPLQLNFTRLRPLLVTAFAVMLWWSSSFWKYLQRVTSIFAPSGQEQTASSENIVNRRTYMLSFDTTEIPMSDWKFTNLRAFNKISLPQPTIDGINRLFSLNMVREKKDLNVLNMSELTPLAVEIPYKLETGPNVPLWYHLGVAMFNRDAERYEDRIRKKQYDLVLFENIPALNNFYPFRVRKVLMDNYTKVDSFFAPRRGDTKGFIEVYVR